MKNITEVDQYMALRPASTEEICHERKKTFRRLPEMPIVNENLDILASFSATCKKNNILFRNWIEDILLTLSSTSFTEVDSRLPHLWHGVD